MNALQRFFISWLIKDIDFEIQRERARLQACRDAIAYDEARIEHLKRQLLTLEINS